MQSALNSSHLPGPQHNDDAFLFYGLIPGYAFLVHHHSNVAHQTRFKVPVLQKVADSEEVSCTIGHIHTKTQSLKLGWWAKLLW